MEKERKHPIQHSIAGIGERNTPFYSTENNLILLRYTIKLKIIEA